MKKQKRNVWLLIVGFVILAALLTSVFFLVRNTFEEEGENSSSSASSSSSSDDLVTDEDPSEGSDGGDVDEEIETSEERLKMQSAIRLIGGSLNPPKQGSGTYNPLLAFNFRLSDLAKKELEGVYDLQILIAEKWVFESLNPSRLDYVDWLPLFKQSNYLYTLTKPTEFEKDGDTWIVRGVTSRLTWAQYNTEYYAIAVLDTGDGYQYTSFAEYEDEVRSVAYIASLELAYNLLAVLCGDPILSAWRIDCFQYYIANSFNLANGWEAEAIVLMHYAFNAADTDIALTVGENYQINYSQSPTGVRLGYVFAAIDKIVFGSAVEDDSIIMVSEDGVITAVGTGTAYVFVGGGGDHMIRKVIVT